MVTQTAPRVVRSNSCKGLNLSWKRAKRKFWGQQVLFETKFLKFGPERANLATLLQMQVAKAGNGSFYY